MVKFQFSDSFLDSSVSLPIDWGERNAHQCGADTYVQKSTLCPSRCKTSNVNCDNRWILSWYPTSIFFQVLILFLLSKKLSISKLFFSFFPDLPYWQNFGGCYPFFCVSTTSFFLLKDVDLLPWRRNWQRAKERLQKNRIPFAYKYILLFLQLRIVKIQLRPTLMEWRGTLCISFVFCNLVVSKSFEHVLDTDIADMLQYYYFLLPSGQSAKKIVHSSSSHEKSIDDRSVTATPPP